MFERSRKEGPDRGPGSASKETAGGFGSAATAGSRARGETGAGTPAVIGRSIRIDGDLRGEEDLRIEGQVSGTIHLNDNSLTIGSQGNIKADVYAKSIIVDGTMDGDLYGSEHVAIRKNAKVVGNITAPRVSLEDGAKFKGSIEMDQQAVDAALGTSRPTKQAMSFGSAHAGDDKVVAKPAPSPAPGGNSSQRESAG